MRKSTHTLTAAYAAQLAEQHVHQLVWQKSPSLHCGYPNYSLAVEISSTSALLATVFPCPAVSANLYAGK